MQEKIVNFFIGLKNFFIKSGIFIASWWRAILFFFALLLFLYYPIGGLIVNNIDRNTDYDFTPPENHLQSETVDMLSHIVDREVNQKVWTPNLPFFFPSTMLDNMPNFQLGMFDAVGNFAYSFRNAFSLDSDMKEISELLNYNGTIWMFSPENKINPISSANRMYREARKKLRAFNVALANNEETFNKRPQDLSFILQKASQNITKSVAALEQHISEESNSLYDGQSDDLFFYHQGKLYGYYLLLNSIGQDYKDIIVANNLYNRWTYLSRALEQASALDPWYVRNAKPNNVFSSNHLSYLAFYGLKADSHIQKLITQLGKI